MVELLRTSNYFAHIHTFEENKSFLGFFPPSHAKMINSSICIYLSLLSLKVNSVEIDSSINMWFIEFRSSFVSLADSHSINLFCYLFFAAGSHCVTLVGLKLLGSADAPRRWDDWHRPSPLLRSAVLSTGLCLFLIAGWALSVRKHVHFQQLGNLNFSY